MAGADFERFVERYHEALDAFFRGDPEPAKRLYSHREDATLANPFGSVAKGWTRVVGAMERAASNYRDGRATGFETLASYVTDELGYTVEVERFDAKIGGSDQVVSVSLRVTSVLRPEDGEWRIVHRHADPITTVRPPESLLPT
jgi:ketosteroid isomerase-like protein